MPLGEAMPGMQNKTIDATIASVSVFTAFKFYDIVKSLTVLPKSYLVVGGLVSRNYMKSLGPELEAIVREEARKAEGIFSTYVVEETERIRQTWEKNGGAWITFPRAEADRYMEQMNSVAQAVMAANPKMKEDYEALLAAAKKYRK